MHSGTGLWVDKHRPNQLSKLDYHKTQASHLKHLVQQGDFPHLLVYGPPGAGKKTRISCILRELYGAGVERLRMETQTFTTPSNKKIDLMTLSSNYHMEVNPSDVGIYDRVVVMDLIKKLAETHQFTSSQRDFKVVVLTEVDHLTREAQHALRRTMEKYVSTCRLILCANSTSSVIPAIRSRCLGVRVPAPTTEEIISILQTVCKKEGQPIPTELASRIAEHSQRNLRRALLLAEACKVQRAPLTDEHQIPSLPWQVYLEGTAKMIVEEQTPKQLMEVRTRLYELIIHGIPAQIIFKGLVDELVKSCDMQLKMRVVEAAAMYEHRMHQGSKTIFHLEGFVAKFMSIYKTFMEEMLGNF
ncbi:replication factor C subunit 3 [Anabrus simplex]|uniref:replication factor C subunit 3 n=1 Tax=Anabrus simplex TaxID=316456 RepID=UPI0034DCDDE8